MQNTRIYHHSSVYLRPSNLFLPNSSISTIHQKNSVRRRGFASNSESNAVELYSSVVPSPHGGQHPPLLFLHGLFGSSSNWRGIASKIASLCSLDCHLLDLRNHGDSPHSLWMDYDLMAKDIVAYAKKHNWSKISILGHSLGGRVAMRTALDFPDMIEKLIVVDVAPNSDLNIAPFQKYIHFMRAIDASKISRKSEADALLRENIPNYALRQFLLSNLVADEHSVYRWKPNFDALEHCLPSLQPFAVSPTSSQQFTGETLFIAGKESHYVQKSHEEVIKKFFPNSNIVHIEGAGHWTHADKPREVVAVAAKYLNGTK